MINPQKAYTYFKNRFSLKKTSKGWYAYECLMCNELESRKKMAVHFHYEVVKCWVCGYKERILDFIADFEDTDYRDARRLLEETKASPIKLEEYEDTSHLVHSEVSLPLGYKSILDGVGVMADRARTYLTKRGFNLEEMDRVGIGYSAEVNELDDDENFFGYIIVPFKIKGKLVYYLGRDYIGNFLRYKNVAKEKVSIGKGDLLFNEDALTIYDEVFITEGWADAWTIGRKGISTQGWSWSATQKTKILKGNAKRIVLVPDAGADPTGETFYKKALQLGIDLLDHKEVVIVDLTEIDGGGKDVNEVGYKKFMEEYKSTPVLTMTSAIEKLMSL